MIAPGGIVPAVPAPLLSKKNTGSEEGNGLHDTQSTGFNVVIAQQPRTPQPKLSGMAHGADGSRNLCLDSGCRRTPRGYSSDSS